MFGQQAVTRAVPNADIIVISDDDSDAEPQPKRRPFRESITIHTPATTRNDSKRPKLGHDVDMDDGTLKAEVFPASNLLSSRVSYDFDKDDQGFARFIPNFNFIPQPHEVIDLEEEPVPGPSNVKQKRPARKRPARRVIPCPYNMNNTLGLRMYCGSGYDIIQAPVESNPIWQKVCQEYDEKLRLAQKKRQEKQELKAQLKEQASWSGAQYTGITHNDVDLNNIQLISSDDEDDDNIGQLTELVPTTTQIQALTKIRDVLPDVDSDAVLELLRGQHESFAFGDEEIEILPDTGALISAFLDMDEYPKQPRHVDTDVGPYEVETGKTIKYKRDGLQGPRYRDRSVALLAECFKHIPTHYIYQKVVELKHLWDTYLYFENFERHWFEQKDKPYKRLRTPRVQIERKYYQPHPIVEEDHTLYVNLVTELQAAKQQGMRNVIKQTSDQDKAKDEAANLEDSKKRGLVLECQVCFDDEIPQNRSVRCQNEAAPHAFCFSCIEQLANSQLGLMKYEMTCMDGSGCKAELEIEGIGRAIPIKTFDRLQLNQQQAELAQAFPEGLEQCPFCDYKALCESIDDEPLFSCQHFECYKVSCRKCRQVSHSKKTCEEARNDRGLGARHKVEEARSEAMMRTCPQCTKKIIKELGCNKMRCPCGAILCYVCKLDLTSLKDAYGHFINNRGTEGCKLHDVGGRFAHDDDADKAEAEAIKAAKANDAGLDENTLKIATDQPKGPAIVNYDRNRYRPDPAFGAFRFEPRFEPRPRPVRPVNDGFDERFAGYGGIANELGEFARLRQRYVNQVVPTPGLAIAERAAQLLDFQRQGPHMQQAAAGLMPRQPYQMPNVGQLQPFGAAAALPIYPRQAANDFLASRTPPAIPDIGMPQRYVPQVPQAVNQNGTDVFRRPARAVREREIPNLLPGYVDLIRDAGIDPRRTIDARQGQPATQRPDPARAYIDDVAFANEGNDFADYKRIGARPPTPGPRAQPNPIPILGRGRDRDVQFNADPAQIVQPLQQGGNDERRRHRRHGGLGRRHRER